MPAARGQHVVIQPVTDIHDVLRGCLRGLDVPGEKLRRWLRYAPFRGSCDEIRLEPGCAQLSLRSGWLVTCNPDDKARMTHGPQTFECIRVEINSTDDWCLGWFSDIKHVPNPIVVLAAFDDSTEYPGKCQRSDPRHLSQLSPGPRLIDKGLAHVEDDSANIVIIRERSQHPSLKARKCSRRVPGRVTSSGDFGLAEVASRSERIDSNQVPACRS